MEKRIHYGKESSQFGELYLPKKECKGIVCFFHGGFWSMPYGLHQLNAVAENLVQEGYAVWNIEYRRTGEPGHTWTATFDDALAAVNKLVDIQQDYPELKEKPISVVGHSAGGHLALWLNTQTLVVNGKRFIGLAPILDLETAYKENAGNGAVEKLLHGTPSVFPERYAFASPIHSTKKNSAEWILHGSADDFVPFEWSRKYYEKWQLETQLIELKESGHMDFLDPDSDAFEALKGVL